MPRLVVLAAPARARIGRRRQRPSGAATALKLGGMNTGVALNKPEPLCGEGKKLERKSEGAGQGSREACYGRRVREWEQEAERTTASVQPSSLPSFVRSFDFDCLLIFADNRE
jgi:hypothetical protein